ncbi:uncharacterized protein LY79DRAFT_673725 [Colletotrichum navitas]|uniref:Uncharacterized protein n=1 Tax=Colletotrichum navitas TaxID=681940 RepID=A0AAD8PNF5_9PEZI|nr:uncharacterized protein LY79DRAFT_673725 [Colletotrichum navitas]KAK1573337.1 hypothetical protein LY79DRAFT_673725 [Colletotrichum navitas]
MRTVGPLLALTGSLALASTCAARPCSEWLASSFVARNALVTRHHDPAVLYGGIARAAVHVRNDTLLRVLEGWDPEYYSLDDIRIGNNLLWLYQRLPGYFATLADGLERSQDDGGGCWLIMNEGVTAMFSYGLLRGVRRGLLEDKYEGVGLKAYGLLTSDFIRDDKNGYVSFMGTYYTSIPVVENDARGGGAFLFAAIEAEQA